MAEPSIDITFNSFEADLNEATAGPKWKRWLSRFEHGLVASKITDKGQMKALLLCHVGDRVYEIYESVADKADDFDGVVKKLNAHFNPKVNEEFEIYNFRRINQSKQEPFEEFVIRLRKAAKSFNFGLTFKLKVFTNYSRLFQQRVEKKSAERNVINR
jgi:hypothetical protein